MQKDERSFEPTLSESNASVAVASLTEHCEAIGATMYNSTQIMEHHEQSPRVQNMSDVLLVNLLAFGGDWCDLSYEEICDIDTIEELAHVVFELATDVSEREVFNTVVSDSSCHRFEIPTSDSWETAPVQEDAGFPAEDVAFETTTVDRNRFAVTASPGSLGTGSTLVAAATDLRHGVCDAIYDQLEDVYSIDATDELFEVHDTIRSAGYTPTLLVMNNGDVATLQENSGPRDNLTIMGVDVVGDTEGRTPPGTALLVDTDYAGYEVEFSSPSVEVETSLSYRAPRSSRGFQSCTISFRWDVNWVLVADEAIGRTKIPLETMSEQFVSV